VARVDDGFFLNKLEESTFELTQVPIGLETPKVPRELETPKLGLTNP
jgi:hypothetical protein